MKTTGFIASFALVLLSSFLIGCGSSVHIGGHPVGPFVFTVGQGSDNVFSFKGSNSGAISPISSAATGHAPSAIQLQSFETFRQSLYVTDSASNNLTVFALDSTSGAVSGTGVSFPVGTNPIAIGLRGASGVGTTTGPVDLGFVYVLNQGTSDISAFRVSDNRGNLAAVPGSPFATQANPQALAVVTGGTSPTNISTFVYVANGALGTISGFASNPDGSLTELAGSPFPAGGNISALAGRIGGVILLASDAGNNRILGFTIGPTGALTPFAGSPVAAGTQPGAILFADSSFVYVANRGSNNVSGYKFDFASSTLTPIPGSPFAAGTGPVALGTTRPAQLYVANQGSSDITAFNIDANSGALTQVSGSPFRVPAPPSSIQTLFIMNVD
jgi:6-phosphogluconolactonase (cycloisomerase 2 family)